MSLFFETVIKSFLRIQRKCELKLALGSDKCFVSFCLIRTLVIAQVTKLKFRSCKTFIERILLNFRNLKCRLAFLCRRVRN